MKSIQEFDDPIYVTRPVMPSYQEYTERLKEIWDTKWLSNEGAQHKKLEQLLLKFLDAPYLSLFNNGTTALIVAIQCLRLQGEVITTPFSFPATTHALTWNGIKPIFCDIDPVTMNIDPRKIERLITNRTTAILGVHVYGTPCDVVSIQEIADRHGLRVVYDAAHAFGVRINGQPIGSFGDISMFSFHPTKLFHTAEGGALVYGDKNLKERIYLLKNFGIKNEFEVILPGINGKMNELSALMGQCVLSKVNNEKLLRRKIRAVYCAELSDIEGISVVSAGDNVETSEQYMVIRIVKEAFGADRDEVCGVLQKHNVFCRKYFYPLISDYPCYNQLLTASPKGLQNSVSASEEVLCLPFYGELSEADAQTICRIIKSVV